MKEQELKSRAFLPMSSFLDPARQLSEPWEEILVVPIIVLFFFLVVPIILVTYMYPSEEGLTFFNTDGERQSG